MRQKGVTIPQCQALPKDADGLAVRHKKTSLVGSDSSPQTPTDASVCMQVERTILCPASEYQKHLSGLVMQGLQGSSGAQQPKARSVSNSVMELRNISNHPFLVRPAPPVLRTDQYAHLTAHGSHNLGLCCHTAG